MYAAADFFYRQNKNNEEVEYYHSNDTSRLNDVFVVNKYNVGFNLILGFQQHLSKTLLVDLYAGIGVMKREAANYKREYNYKNDNLVTPIEGFTFGAVLANFSEESGWKANISFGVRIGIRL